LVAIKAALVPRFVQSPSPECIAALVFGTDPGLVAERAKLLATALASRNDPPSEIIRIEDVDLETDSGRLLIELQTEPMFGGGKVIRSTLSRRINGTAIKQIFASGPPAANLVIEGGNLKPSDAARKLFDATPWAASIACYGDNQRDLSAIVAEMTGEAGMSLEPDARELLLARLGADRALSRGEVEKLIIYATGRTTITADDVDAVVGDASELVMDQIASAAASGAGEAALMDFNRAQAAGDNPQTLLLAVQRYFLRLHRLRSGMEAGKSVADAMRTMRPPVHFKQRDILSAQCQAWPLTRLTGAVVRISETIKSARLNSSLQGPLAERLLIDLSLIARAGRRR